MSLKIVRYMNYGHTMGSDPYFGSEIEGEKSKYSNEFYWSFFELSNGKIISLHFVENLQFDKLTSTDMFLNYTNSYKFGEEFFDWWDKTFTDKEKNLGFPNEEEESLVKKFYKEKIEIKRDVKTEIINL